MSELEHNTRNSSTASATRLSRTAAALGTVCLIGGPALIALGLALSVEPWAGSAPDYDVIAENGGRMRLSTNLALLAMPLLMGATVALAGAARRAGALASLGLLLTLFGLTSMALNAMISWPLTLIDGIDDSANRTGIEAMTQALDTTFPIATFLFPLYLIGTILLAAALHRSRVVPTWSTVAIAVGGLFPIAVITGVGAIAIVFAAIRIAGSVPVIKVLFNRQDTSP